MFGSARQCRREIVDVDATCAVHAHDTTAAVLHRMQHRVVLGGWADGDAAMAPLRSDDRRVVALGPAPGEDDLPGVATQRFGDDLARLVDGLTDGSGEPVRAAGVGETLCQERQHRLHRLGAHRSGGRMIEIGERVGGIHAPEGTADCRAGIG